MATRADRRADRQKKKEQKELEKALKNVKITSSQIKPDTRSVTTKDYEGGGSEVTRAETSGTTGTTTRRTTTSRSKATGEIITPITTVTRIEQGKGMVSQYTEQQQPSYSDLRTQENLRKEQERLQNFYQEKVNRGYDVNKATNELNRDYELYQANVYSNLGYLGTSTYEGTQLQREELPPIKNVTFQKEEEKPKSFFFKVGEFVKSKEREGYKTERDTLSYEEAYPLRGAIREKIRSSDWYQRKKEEGGFFFTGILPAKKVEFNTIFGKDTISLGERKIDFGKASARVDEFAKWIFFSPAMATGTQAVLEQQGELVYDYTTGRWMRRNRLTGKLEPDVTTSTLTKIEKDLAMKGTIKEQLKYLSEQYSKLKTDVAKENFKKFVEELRLKGVIKDTTFVIKPSGRIKPPKITPIEDNLPSMVGGTGLKNLPKPNEIIIDVLSVGNGNIKYAGAIGGLVGLGKTKSVGEIKEVDILSPVKKTSLVTTSFLSLVPTISNVSGTTTINKPSSKSSQRLFEQQIQPQPQIFIQPQPQISSSQSLLRSSTTQILKQPSKQQFKFKPINIPIIFKQKQGMKTEEMFLKPSKKREIFETFLKRKGKDISLGKFGELGEAKIKFLKEVKTTLGASGFITKGGKVVPLKELNLGYEFAPSKRQPFRAVQKRGFRLSSKGEVSEILSSKKAKGRKIKWL